mmetsp:Transcript_8737/g.32938  ORF Transcript_8737/g.32938 Transcript_8737/m.32938 type:complete len:204 (-) Transcript_8737:1175-1786(-)
MGGMPPGALPLRPPIPPPPGPRPTPLASAAPGCSVLGFLTVSSMLRMRHAASEAAAKELTLFGAGSHTFDWNVSVMPSTSTLTPYQRPFSSFACFMRRLFRTSVASNPALSASCRGMTSSALAILFMMSCSLPSIFRASSRTNLETSISIAPPPATTSPLLIARFTMQSASWMDRCVSSMNCSEPPRSTIVAVRLRGHPVKRL